MPKRVASSPQEFEDYQKNATKAIGDRIRQRRDELGLTQEQVRARLEIERVLITRTQYSRIELGQRLPSALELYALTVALETTFNLILPTMAGTAR